MFSLVGSLECFPTPILPAQEALSSVFGDQFTELVGGSRLSRSGPCRITEIAEQERISQPTVTAMVMRLEQRGLVERGSDPADGRAVLVSITDAGRELLRRRRQTQVDQLSGLLDALDATEQSAVVTAIGALRRLANSAQVTGAPAA